MIMIAYAAAGILAGLVGGMLGIGGGIVIVPVLHYLFQYQGFPASSLMQVVIATSLATIVVTSVAATYAHHRKGAVLWPVLFRFVPGLLIGSCLGAMLADIVSSDFLRFIFGAFEILVALQIGFNLTPGARTALPNASVLAGSGTGIGFFSTLLGIGGGTLTVPFLLWHNVNIRNAVAVSSACGFPVAVAGTATMIVAGQDNSGLPEHAFGYLYWPAALLIMAMTVVFAPYGAKLTHYLPVDILKRLFAVLLFIVGVRMLVPA